MPFYDDAELLHTLREGELLPAYLIYGKETYLAEVCLQRILEKAVKKGTENFNLRRFDGASLDMAAVRSEAESLPLMAAYKCVVVHNPNLEKLSKSDSDTLQQILADPNPSTVLVLFVTAFDLNPKKSAKLQKLMDQVARVGAVVACQPKTRSDLTRLLRQKFQKAGCEMSSYTAGAMVDRCGMALKTLMAESDKLIAYRQSGEITLADVEAVTHKSLDASIYDLSRAMLQKGRTKAFLLLDELFAQRQEPTVILSAISSAFVDLYRAKAALLAGKDAKDLLALFPYRGREFLVKNAFRDVAPYSARTLRGCLETLADADLALKSSRADPKIVLEQTVAQILDLKEEGR
ncbi:MAG: DNA polymerase III subunit delta [Oscillospiraceae bacterium]|jgi:DNA polymerase-3 subunit delta|nr:DNA polymerase III subunit delta [Oscillospiraceae bacterium]